MATILAQLVRAAIDYLATRGVEAPAIKEEPGDGVTPSRVYRTYYDALWVKARRELGGHPWVPFVESRLDAEQLGLFGYMTRSEATIRRALVKSTAYLRFVMDDISAWTRPEPRGLRLVCASTAGGGMAERDVECVLLAHAALGRRWSGFREGILEATFRRERDREAAELEDALQCPVRYGQPEDGVLVSTDFLAAPLENAEPVLARELECVVESHSRTLSSAPLKLELRRVLVANLERGGPDVARAARLLGTSPRTLQRQLQRLGASFRLELDEARRERALVALKEGETSFEAIALSVGFSDVRAFRRAVRRWTGASPREVARGTRDSGG